MSDARRPLLVVEDDPALQKQMKWAFDGYEVAVASDRESAIAQLRRFEPAVVTMDLGLPPRPDDPDEGFRTLQEILSIAPDTKVIVLGALNDVIVYRNLKRQGISEYLPVPLDAKAVVEIVVGLFVEPGAEKLGRLVSFMGTSGGAGTSRSS